MVEPAVNDGPRREDGPPRPTHSRLQPLKEIAKAVRAPYEELLKAARNEEFEATQPGRTVMACIEDVEAWLLANCPVKKGDDDGTVQD